MRKNIFSKQNFYLFVQRHICNPEIKIKFSSATAFIIINISANCFVFIDIRK